MVPSVTLGGLGISWAVLRGGSAFKGCRDEIVLDNVSDGAGKDLFCCLTCTICEMPLPNKAKAGISIQNHQTFPPISPPNKPTAIATKRKPIPMNSCLMPSAIEGVALRRRLRRASRRDSPNATAGLASGSWPVSACGTRLMLAPQDRQKLAPSRFWVAHFGQNILASCDLTKGFRRRAGSMQSNVRSDAAVSIF